MSGKSASQRNIVEQIDELRQKMQLLGRYYYDCCLSFDLLNNIIDRVVFVGETRGGREEFCREVGR